MEEDAWYFSLDAKQVDEKEVRSPTLFPVSIIASTIFSGDEITNPKGTRDLIQNTILKKYPFKQFSFRTYKEGFLEFMESSENELLCFYGKETPTKIMYEAGDLRIHSKRFSLLNPAYTVRVKITINTKSIRIITFGGQDTLIAKALDQLNICIVSALSGSHKIVDTKFSKEEMTGILNRFGNVEYIWIHPGDSDKFVKFTEKKDGHGISKVPEYMVHAKLHGFHITWSPIVSSLIRESGIFLKEIQGSLPLGLKKPITSRVSSEGKAIFFIPETAVPSGSSAYEVAESLYEKLIVPATNVTGTRQTTFHDFSYSAFENEISLATLLEMTSEEQLRDIDFCKRTLLWALRDKNNAAISAFLHKAYNIFIFDEQFRTSLLKVMHDVFGAQPFENINETFKGSTVGEIFVISELLSRNQIIDLAKLKQLADSGIINRIVEKSGAYLIPTNNRSSLDITNDLPAMKVIENIDKLIVATEFLLSNRLLKKNEMTIFGVKTLYEASKSPLIVAKSKLFTVKQPENYLFYEFKQLIDEYSDLLQNLAEEPEFQSFFERNPFFLNPQYLKCMPKKPFGGELFPDFVLELYDKTTLIIEIEKPSVKLYTTKGDPTKELSHAEQQLRDYLRWAIKENSYLREHGIENISTDKTTGILVIGSKISELEVSKLDERNKTQKTSFVVKTFYDVLEENTAILENLKKMSHKDQQN
jgi:hypothetical protein